MLKRKKIPKLKLINFNKLVSSLNYKELHVLNGIISDIKNDTGFFELDCTDCILAPGFVDVQVNGLGSCNFWDISTLNYEAIDNLRLELAFSGVVAFCPTIITASEDKIIKTIDHINSYLKSAPNDAGARILGIHIEGIFITKCGVHDPKYVKKELTVKNIRPYMNENVILWTLAPELDETGEAIRFLKERKILVSIGHSSASYREGVLAIEKYNLETVSHMFNALRGIKDFSHRTEDRLDLNILISKLEDQSKIKPDEDGIMLAVLKNKNVLTMIISDGLHVHKDLVGFLRNYKGKDNFALVSDYVSQPSFNLAKSKNTLGGSQTTLDNCVLNLVSWGVCSLEDALISASYPVSQRVPAAREIGLGNIQTGKEANIVIWDTKKNAVRGTIIGENVFLKY